MALLNDIFRLGITIGVQNVEVEVPQAKCAEKIFSAPFAHPLIAPPFECIRWSRPRKFVGDYRSSKSSTISDRKAANSIISLGKRFEYLSIADMS